jgi:hypothetical protein
MNTTTSNKLSIWSKENTLFLLTFLFTVIVVYILPHLYIPQPLIKIIFLLLLFVVFRSKNDAFWLSWFFVVINAPGRLFSIGYSSTIYRLPLYRLGPGVAIGFDELFLLIYLLKFLLKKDKNNNIFNKYWIIILIYGFITLFYSFGIGLSSGNVVTAIRMIIPWFWVLILPEFISDSDKLAEAFKLLAPFVFINFLIQIYTQITGQYLNDILSGEIWYGFLGSAEEELVRISDGCAVNLFCMIMSLFYLCSEDKRFNRIYLNLLVVIYLIFILMTATRGWIVASLILLSSVFFMRGFNFIKQFTSTLLILILFIFLLRIIYPSFILQASLALERFKTLKFLISGDPTAGGTLARISERSPRVMSVFRESPVIGWGLSDRYFRSWDGHVGNQTMLMQGGIIGYAIWIICYFLTLLNIYFLNRNSIVRSHIKNGGIVFLMAMIAIFVIHSSSSQILGFNGNVLFFRYLLAFIIAATNATFISSLNNKKL